VVIRVRAEDGCWLGHGGGGRWGSVANVCVVGGRTVACGCGQVARAVDLDDGVLKQGRARVGTRGRISALLDFNQCV
jgi:hypothetical protein